MKNLLLCIFFLASLTLFFHKIGADNQWHDEAKNVIAAQKPLPEMLSNVFSMSKDPFKSQLYFLVTTYCEKLIFLISPNPSDALLRMPSAMFGVLAIVVLFLLGYKINRYYGGIWAALLLLLNLHSIYFAQEIRPYSFVIAISSLLLLSQLKLLYSVNWKNLLLFLIVCGILPYSHPSIMPLLVPIPFVFLLQLLIDFKIIKNKKQLIKQWSKIFAVGALISILYIPAIRFWLLFANFTSGSQSKSYNFSVYSNSIYKFISNTLHEQLMQMPYCNIVCYPRYIYNIFIVLGIIGVIACFRKHWRLVIHFLLTITVIGYLKKNYASESYSRHYLFLLPFCFVFISCGIVFVTQFINSTLLIVIRDKPRRKFCSWLFMFFLNIILIFLFIKNAVPAVKKYYNVRQNLHAPSRQAIDFLLKNSKSNTFFFAPIKPYDEFYAFKWYFSNTSSGIQKSNVLNPNNLDKLKSYKKVNACWFISQIIDPSKLKISPEEVNITKFRNITIVKTFKPISCSKVLFYTKELWQRELNILNSSYALGVPNTTAEKWYKDMLGIALSRIINIAGTNFIYYSELPFFQNNLVKNSCFADNLNNWYKWKDANKYTNSIKIISNVRCKNIKNAVRIENPYKKFLGVRQNINVSSGTIYQLTGYARSIYDNRKKLFGGRIGFWLPPQKEKEIVWMSEYNQWWKKELVFTNQVSGMATVYVHMGYGNVASTGEFTDIRLEKIGETKNGGQQVNCAFQRKKQDVYQKVEIISKNKQYTENLTQIVCLAKSKTNIFYKSVWEALQNAENNSTIHIAPGKYIEKQYDMMIPLTSNLTNLQIIGHGQPIINVNLTNVSWCNEVALNIPNNVNLYISNIVVRSSLKAFNTQKSYNINLNNCKNAIIESCIFESEIYGTNNNFKNFIAIGGAKNVLVKNSSIITSDMTDSNSVWHVATHDAEPTKFVDCTFISTNIKYICIGKSIFSNCFEKTGSGVNSLQ